MKPPAPRRHLVRCPDTGEAFATHVWPGLTARQVAVLRDTADGMTIDEIATRCGVSIHAVYTDMCAATERLGARNRVHAMLLAGRAGIL